MAEINGKKIKLRFGYFADRAYLDILKYEPMYVEFLLGEGESGGPDKNKFAVGENTGDSR